LYFAKCIGLSAGTLMGITNMIATIPGFVSPTIVGVLTDGDVSNDALYMKFRVKINTG